MGLFSRKDRTDVSDPAKLLVVDHQKVEHLFDQVKAADGVVERQGLVAQLADELERHATIEEQVLYPFIRDNVEDGESMVAEAVDEHMQARLAADRMRAMDPGDPGLLDAVADLERTVHHHVKEEEAELFPKLEAATSPERLGELRGQLEAAKAEGHPVRPIDADPPPRRPAKRAATKKAGAKKTTAKKATAKRATAKKATAKRATAKRAPAKKATAKKATAKRATAKKAPARKATAKRATAKKAPARKATAKRATAKKAPARKAMARKATAKRATAKKATAQRTAARKAPTKKATAKRAAATKKRAATRAPGRRR